MSLRPLARTPPRSVVQVVRHKSPISFVQHRYLGKTRTYTMPQELKQSEIDSKTDPSVAKQYDSSASMDEQFNDLYSIVDGLKTCMLNTYREGTGPVGRSMALAKRVGPDFLYLANAHSNKIKVDLAKNKEVQITFQDTKNQDWVTVAGTAATVDNKDPRIKDLYSPTISAWFGDLGDGVHNGGDSSTTVLVVVMCSHLAGKAEDPRMTLIEVKSKYICYWKHTVGALGFMKVR